MMRSRHWSESNLPRPGGPRVPRRLNTDVFCGIERVIWESRDDPFSLGVALAAWCRLGYPPGNWVHALGSRPNWTAKAGEQWSDDRCHEAAEAALKGRRRRDLTARADGLIVGLIVLAKDAARARLHAVQVDSAVIECRLLTVEERVARLRNMEAARAIGA